MAKTVLELKDEKTNVLKANDTLFELATAEKRSLTDKELGVIEVNNLKAKAFDLQIESESRKLDRGVMVPGNPKIIEEPTERFSLIKAIRAQAERREMPAVARDMTVLGRLEFRNSGINSSGDIILPFEQRAGDILAGTPTKGQEIVAEDKKAILPPLVDKLILVKAGATFLTGLVGDVSLPSYSGTTVDWALTETAEADDGSGTFGEVLFQPKRITAHLDISKTFLAQDGVGAEKLLLENIADAVARKLEKTILGVEEFETYKPEGVGFVDIAAAKVAPTFALVVAMETAIDTASALVGNLAYITNGAGRGILKSTPKVADTDSKMLSEDGQLNGYPLLVTNAASDAAGSDAGELLAFGNWGDVCIAQWGGYDITVDPYTLSINNKVRVVINAYFDAKGMRGTLNNYANSITTIAIKASA